MTRMIAILSVLLLAATGVQAREVPAGRAQVNLSFAPVVAAAAPAVVNIYTRRIVQRQRAPRIFDDPFFERFFGNPRGEDTTRRKRIQNSLGSGVIVRANGIIVTNHHVIENADEITVVLKDRREFEAEVILTDERTDLAILRIDPDADALPVIEFADSDAILVGDLVLAVGNPFGVGQTVTSGIISALARSQAGVSDYQFFVQTDASINPGNSGGALVGMDGRLIGINTAIYSRSGGSIGIGFAIPANMVQQVVRAALNGGRIVRPWVGMVGQEVTADIAPTLGLDRPGGVLVSGITDGGPAARAGLRIGDVVLRVNGFDVVTPRAMRYRISLKGTGGTANLEYWRGGKIRTAFLPLEAPPENPPRNVTLLRGDTPLTGVTIANLSPAVGEEFGIPTPHTGVVILEIGRGSYARRLGLSPGDRIEGINEHTVRTVKDVTRATAERRRNWEFTVRGRDGRLKNLIVRG